MDHDTDKVYDAVRGLPYPNEPGWDQLSTAQQQFVSMSVVEGQVFNGGFHQVYFNDCHAFLPAALAGYRAIGAKPQAEIVERVMAMVREDPWSGPPDIWPDPNAEERPPRIEGHRRLRPAVVRPRPARAPPPQARLPQRPPRPVPPPHQARPQPSITPANGSDRRRLSPPT